MTAQITDRLAIALAQCNPTVGDLAGNLAIARTARARAAAEGADLLVLTELFLSGYPPEDLVLKPAFVAAVRAAAEELARDTADGGPGIVVGAPWAGERRPTNAAVLLDAGRIAAVRPKVHLPNYGVFDEQRVFEAGPLPGPADFRGVRLGLPICEDCWFEDVTECLAETGAEILIVPNGSPFDRGKRDVRLGHMVARVTETGLPLIYVNQVGGQDELVFDGASFVLQADRTVPVQLPAFEEAFAVTEWRRDAEGWLCRTAIDRELDDGQEAVWRACVLGLGDYVVKNGFPGVVIGLSGGIDSALTAAMAVDALGADKVRCVMMPSRYTSRASLDDAEACADALGVALDEVPIGAVVAGLTTSLEPLFDAMAPDTTEENLQSRARGVILMAISNKFGAMVVTTGNKSEMSVGYATLYGDMAGGYNPLKDLYKTEVYALARMRNQRLPAGCRGPAGRVVPESIIVKAPTAELKDNQTDQDTLPPYDQLDAILKGLVEEEVSVADLIGRGHAAQTVARVERMLYLAEYKRRQAAPGVKISARNFGRDRRYPITNRFRDRAR
jgi:NAD+ synthase